MLSQWQLQTRRSAIVAAGHPPTASHLGPQVLKHHQRGRKGEGEGGGGGSNYAPTGWVQISEKYCTGIPLPKPPTSASPTDNTCASSGTVSDCLWNGAGHGSVCAATPTCYSWAQKTTPPPPEPISTKDDDDDDDGPNCTVRGDSGDTCIPW
ncbi:hypothetical protein F5Y06DRAFT_268321 [Hypoxylon sp. FL0890]|nr:hypothetical protein F5Y06DRAFT_268321 [Hypoxylon sp. FL0890]